MDNDMETLDYYGVLRQRYNIPSSFSKLICMCDDKLWNIGIKESDDKRYNYWVCTKCNRLPRYHFFRCFQCEEYFVKDFKHPNFCVLDPLCWDCITNPENKDFCYHKPLYVDLMLGESPPFLPKPRKFTVEELENVFDF